MTDIQNRHASWFDRVQAGATEDHYGGRPTDAMLALAEEASYRLETPITLELYKGRVMAKMRHVYYTGHTFSEVLRKAIADHEDGEELEDVVATAKLLVRHLPRTPADVEKELLDATDMVLSTFRVISASNRYMRLVSARVVAGLAMGPL